MNDLPPLVTVITPTYNNANYLAETIDSVLAQDYPSIEYIVLDDGSTDHTNEVLRQYAGQIIAEAHANMGEAKTVNRGFGMANGDFVMVVNGDDPLLPRAIVSQVEYLQAHPDVYATYPDWVEIDENSQSLEERLAWDYDYSTMVRRVACVPGPGAMIRKSGIELVSGRNTNYRFVTDMDFWFRLAMHGSLAHIPQFLATHRTHSASSGVAYRNEVGIEIVNYMQTFFMRDDLPQNVLKLRNEALSSAHVQAGTRATNYSDRRQHFLQAFRLYPLNWIINEDCRALWKYGALLLPEFAYKMLRPLLSPYKRWKQRND